MTDTAPPRVLFIDDDAGLRQLARRRLGTAGWAVTAAAGGEEGVELAAEGGFDLVVLDHYMPGMDGIATLERLMALPDPPVVIYATGTDESSIAVAALKAGALDYVVKTVTDDFFELLGRTMAQARDSRRLAERKEQAEQELRVTNAKLEAMLGEMNHRVANSLQMVSALVALQARKAEGDEARLLLQGIRQRIHAVAQVHRQLSVGRGSGTIEVADYLAELGRDLEQSFSTAANPRHVRVVADAADVPAAMAVTLGMLVNELVSNACKYAYREGQDGEVRIRFAVQPHAGFVLSVEDDGCGTHDSTPPQGTGLGAQIIRAMADTLEAELIQRNTVTGYRVELVRAPRPAAD